MRSIQVVSAAALFASLIAARNASGGYTAVDLYAITAPPGFADGEPSVLAPISGGQVVGSGQIDPGSTSRALLWMSPGIAIGLTPTWTDRAVANATDGRQQMGSAGVAPGSHTGHATLWTGTADSAVDLNPQGYLQSEAVGVHGGQQVGDARAPDGGIHAFLWNGSAASGVDLTPAAAGNSFADATDGVHQVGFAIGGGGFRAFLWSGSAASAVDLSPRLLGFGTSIASGVSGDEEVGWGNLGVNENHALLWRGTPGSAIDLNPPGAATSHAFATDGLREVGDMVGPDGRRYAVVWSGAAESAVDLNALLPAAWTSQAFSIDSDGNIFGIAQDPSFQRHAVEWQAPEASLHGLLLPLMLLIRPHR